MVVLQTMRLTLSPCCPGDRADFIDLELDPEVMRFLNGGHPVNHEQLDPNAPFLMPRGTEAHVWTGGYDKAIGTTMAVNHASRRVMEKVGMTHTRTDYIDRPDPIPGSEEGEVWYELTRSEWTLLR